MSEPAGAWMERYIDLESSHEWMRYHWPISWPGHAHRIDFAMVACQPQSFVLARITAASIFRGIRDGRLAPDSASEAFSRAPYDRVREMCQSDPDEAMSCTGGQLLSWCEFVRDEPCPNCDGTGTIPPHIPDADAICIECEGLGRFRPGRVCVRPGLIHGVHFDRNRLGWLLAPELVGPDTPLTLGVLPVPQTSGGSASHLLVIDGDGFRLGLASLDPEGGAVATAKEVPAFRPDDHYLSLFLEREDPVSRMALADYCLDYPVGVCS